MMMVVDKVGRAGASQCNPVARDHGGAGDPFKRWLRQGLLGAADRYAQSAPQDLHEPLPEAWLKLLDRLPPTG
jgi:hypothetical protein